MRRISTVILAGMLLGSAGAAAAQADDDILVMRRVITKQVPAAPPSTPGLTYDWDVQEYGPWSTTCGSNAVRTRTVTCLASDDTIAPDDRCVEKGAKPPVQEGPVENRTNCQVTCSIPIQGKASGGPTVPGGSLGPVGSAAEAAQKCTAFGRLNGYHDGICIYWKGNAYYNSGQLINYPNFSGSICSA